MLLDTLGALDEALRTSWDRETCDPVDLDRWRPETPARGQCGVTALVVQDVLGGDLVLAEVRNADGTRQGVHSRVTTRLEGSHDLTPRVPTASSVRKSH